MAFHLAMSNQWFPAGLPWKYIIKITYPGGNRHFYVILSCYMSEVYPGSICTCGRDVQMSGRHNSMIRLYLCRLQCLGFEFPLI
jgi:hypothetical protein